MTKERLRRAVGGHQDKERRTDAGGRGNHRRFWSVQDRLASSLRRRGGVRPRSKKPMRLAAASGSEVGVLFEEAGSAT